MLWIGIITLFPEMFKAITEYGITGRAFKTNIVQILCFNPRNFSNHPKKKVDDRPYGGSSGMLMMIQPIQQAIRYAKNISGDEKNVKVIYLSPQGKKINQDIICQLSTNKKIILVCGRYKGIDERIIQSEINYELSIGDYILSGGELPAMIVIDCIIRLLPGILNKKSIEEDSFIKNLLDCPRYTKPKIFNGMKVPSVLLSGDHNKIIRWNKKQSLGRTWIKRPEMLKSLFLDSDQKELLSEFKKEYYMKKEK